MDLESSNQSVWSGEGCLPEENRKRIKKLIVELMYMSVWRDVLQFCQSQEWISSRHTENYQFSSVAQSCPTICDPMGCSTPGFPVHHQLPELTQSHVHWVGDAIQSFHPLSSPSPPAFNLSQHQGLFQWVSSLHQKIKQSRKMGQVVTLGKTKTYKRKEMSLTNLCGSSVTTFLVILL